VAGVKNANSIRIGLPFGGGIKDNTGGMNKTNTKPVKHPHHQTATRREPVCQVVLHNDDVNSVEHVVTCLQTVFAHNMELAAKIMLEAHKNGRSIAEVENETPAVEHRDQLRAYGLSSTVEPI